MTAKHGTNKPALNAISLKVFHLPPGQCVDWARLQDNMPALKPGISVDFIDITTGDARMREEMIKQEMCGTSTPLVAAFRGIRLFAWFEGVNENNEEAFSDFLLTNGLIVGNLVLAQSVGSS